MIASILLLAGVSLVDAAYLEHRQAPSGSSTTAVPQIFQTSPEIYAGPTKTGAVPFLAETNPAPFGSTTFKPNTPLETALPIPGNVKDQNIFQLMGQVSPYSPNPDGFGAQEYSLPAGSNISQVHVLHRHGSRYPTSDTNVASFGGRIANATKAGTFNASGGLAFLNSWSYQLGAEILVPVGRQELFDSGVLHYYQYGRLYDPKTKIIARTTTQDRMLKSAENFMTGFFGLEWTQNVTLEVQIEQPNFNTTLAGYFQCNNSNAAVNTGGNNASLAWQQIYLANATGRFQSLVKGYNWTLTDTYAAQTLCPYETVAFGYSAFCDLFTYEEWQGFEYSIDLSFNGGSGFQSPTGRAVGIGYQQEIVARLQHHLITTAETQVNVTLDNNEQTFPLNQTLYFDFSHDTNIVSILTAFGLTQFRQYLPPEGPPASRSLIISHIVPFGVRLDIEIIKAPQPIPADRSCAYVSGPPTTYVHFILNQRTLPLGVSLPACGQRVDGWCEINNFLESQKDALQLANYNFACNGNYPVKPYGAITNGAPV